MILQAGGTLLRLVRRENDNLTYNGLSTAGHTIALCFNEWRGLTAALPFLRKTLNLYRSPNRIGINGGQMNCPPVLFCDTAVCLRNCVRWRVNPHGDLRRL